MPTIVGANQKTTITSLLRIASLLAGVLLLLIPLALLIGYHAAIHSPGQSGWSLFRLAEITPQILPFLLLGATTLALATLRPGKFLFALLFLPFLLSGGFLLFLHLSGIFLSGGLSLTSGLILLLTLTPFAWIISAIITSQHAAGPSPAAPSP